MQICEGSNSQSGHNIQAPMLWLAVNLHKERRKIKSRDIWTPAVVYCTLNRSFQTRQVISNAEDNLKPSTLSSLGST